MKIYHLAFVLLSVLFSCQYGTSETPESGTFGIDVSHHQGKTGWKKAGEERSCFFEVTKWGSYSPFGQMTGLFL